jgi:hypothetical protein
LRQTATAPFDCAADDKSKLSPKLNSLPHRDQAGIPARRCCVHTHHLFQRKAQQVMRAAGFEACAGKAGAAEGLRANHRADDVAVDIDIADIQPVDHVAHGFFDAGVDAEVSSNELVVQGTRRPASSAKLKTSHSVCFDITLAASCFDFAVSEIFFLASSIKDLALSSSNR